MSKLTFWEHHVVQKDGEVVADIGRTQHGLWFLEISPHDPWLSKITQHETLEEAKAAAREALGG